MRLTNKLLGFLHRVFDKRPAQFLALRLSYRGGMSWQVADGVLTTAVTGGPGVGLVVPLRDYTIAQLVGFLAAQPGYTVLYIDGTANAQLSAAVLIDGAGDISLSNGDNLLGYTSFVWTYLEAQAIELAAAEDQGQQALRQMNAITAEGEWLDELGGYYGVPRLALPVPNLLAPSNNFDAAPWLQSGLVSAAQTAVAGPLGMSLTKLVPTTDNGPHYLYADVAVDVAANTGTASVFAAAAGYGFLLLQFRQRDGVTLAWVFCNLATGAFSSPSTASAGVSIVPTAYSAELVDGMWRFSVTAPLGVGASAPRVMIQAASDAATSTFAGDGASGIYIAGAQFEASGTRTPYLAGGTTYPEDDAQYSPRMIAEILRPRGNNVAIEAAIKQFTGQSASVIDVTLYGPASPKFDALVKFDGSKQYNAQAALILGLFDVQYSYDLLSGSDITIFRKTLRDLINKMRDAGTQLRSLLLTGSALSDDFPNAPIDAADVADLGLASTYTAADAFTAPDDAAATVLATVMADLPDTFTAPGDGAGLTVAFSTKHDGLRAYNGLVQYRGGLTYTGGTLEDGFDGVAAPTA